MRKLSKIEAERQIEDFFKNIKNKCPKEIKKIKKLAMSHKIKLGNKRKLFCKKCLSPKLKILGIKQGIKKVKCESCGNSSKYKIK